MMRAECMGGSDKKDKKDKKKKGKNDKKKSGDDLYRDTNLRYVGYANEIGEALRPAIGRHLVTVTYALASAYILADVGAKSSDAWKTKKDTTETFKKGADALIWQSLASVIVPGFVLNRLGALTRFVVCRSSAHQFRSFFVAAATLTAIPFIVEPIDRFVEGFMNDFIRPMYNNKNNKA